MFKARTTKPEKGNPYYNTIGNGGYSKAIKGKPVDSDCDVLSNCVGYAYGRYHEIAECKEMNLFDAVNAENILANAESHGLATGKNPEIGAVIVWKKGTLSGKDGAGHVAIVEQINSDGTILTSESGYGCKTPFWVSKRSGKNWGMGIDYEFIGFVYQPKTPATNKTIPVKLPIRKGMQGAHVKWLQNRLIDKGYLRRTENDGDFGKITLGALLAFQFENNLEVDGVCGTQTYNALK